MIKKRIEAEEEVKRHQDHLENMVQQRTVELQEAMEEIKTLSGFLPICSHCKNIRDDKGYWQRIESYIEKHSEAEFSHSICPDCIKKYYPDYYKKKLSDTGNNNE